MSNILLVMLRELRVTLRRPSFYFATFVVPLITGAFFLGSTLFSRAFDPSDQSGPLAEQFKPSGLVDRAGVVHEIPLDIHTVLIPYADEAAAAQAVRDGSIGSYFVIDQDYVENGRVTRVSPQVSFTAGGGRDVSTLSLLLRGQLADDPRIAARLTGSPTIQREIIGDEANQARAEQPLLSGGLALGIAFLLAFAILNGGGGLVQAVTEEKENRTIEVVLTSVRPWQFMTGKLAGLGLIGLIQLFLWLVLGRGAIGLGNALGGIDLRLLNPMLAVWLIVFFLLGYLFYGGLMAAIGALGATARESGQVVGFLTLPLLMPLWFGSALSDQPDGMLAIVLSLVPFTSPVTMMLRLAQGSVPALQILLSIALLAVSIVGTLWLAARLFHATTLLSGVKPTPRALLQALRR